MSNLNYYGFQGGLPSFSIPWGIWVNKALAESKNINVPDPDWTIDEYTRFFTKSDNTSFWGDKSTPVNIINMGTTTINKQIKEKGTVDLDSDEVKSLLSYIPKGLLQQSTLLKVQEHFQKILRLKARLTHGITSVTTDV